MNQTNPLRDNDKAYFRVPLELLRSKGYNFVRGMETTYFYSTVNPEDTTYTTAVPSIDGSKLPEERYALAMTTWRHRRSSVKIIRVEDVVD